MCEGEEKYLVVNEAVEGFLNPGNWSFLILNLSPDVIEKLHKKLVVDFIVSQAGEGHKGHPVLLAKKNDYPSLVDHDYRFTSRLTFKKFMRFQIPLSHILDGRLIFAIFNIDYFVHEPFT